MSGVQVPHGLLMIEGPRIPRSRDHDWRMRNDSGNLKPEFESVYLQTFPNGQLRGQRENYHMLDDFASGWDKYKKEKDERNKKY
jgi:hypothetical protein